MHGRCWLVAFLALRMVVIAPCVGISIHADNHNHGPGHNVPSLLSRCDFVFLAALTSVLCGSQRAQPALAQYACSLVMASWKVGAEVGAGL